MSVQSWFMWVITGQPKLVCPFLESIGKICLWIHGFSWTSTRGHTSGGWPMITYLSQISKNRETSRKLRKSDGWLGWMVWENLRNPDFWHALMIYIYIYIYIYIATPLSLFSRSQRNFPKLLGSRFFENLTHTESLVESHTLFRCLTLPHW